MIKSLARMQRKFNQTVFIDSRGRNNNQLERDIRDMSKVTNVFKKAGETVINFYLCEFAGGPSLWI